jgi:hypothetical protein
MSAEVLPLHPVEAGQAGFSVAGLARRWKVGEDKVRGWIARGELAAVNVASTLAGRPRWRIMPDAVTQFEKRRGSAPPPKPQRRRRRQETVDFYP